MLSGFNHYTEKELSGSADSSFFMDCGLLQPALCNCYVGLL